MSAVADGVGCGLCAPAARGRGRGRGRESGERRSGEGRGHRVVKLSIADGTALRNIVGEEVAATFRSLEIRLRASLFIAPNTLLIV